MTDNEAKEYMENEIRCIQRASYCDRDCAKCELVKEEEPLIEAFGMAIQALEKQMPKKAIVRGVMGFDSEETYYCPNCKERLYTEHFDIGYCNCGQSIKV